MAKNRTYFITEEILEGYKKHLIREEKSRITINKYIRDIKISVICYGQVHHKGTCGCI